MASGAPGNSLIKGVFGIDDKKEIPGLIPGVVLALVIMLVAVPLAEALGHWLLSLQGIDPAGKSSPVSGVLMAIVIGMLVGNFVPLPDIFRGGIRFSVTKLLRLGIILVGIKLSPMIFSMSSSE